MGKLNIQILEAGTQVAIKIGNETNYYERENLEVYSTTGGLVGLKTIDTNLQIVEEHPTEYLIPKEASVVDLIQDIKEIIEVVFIDGLTKNEVEAIQAGDNPSSSNGFETASQLDSRDTANRDRTNHTGTQPSSTISDFAATVIAAVLTGFSVGGASTILSTDTVLEAFGKVQGQINNFTTLLSGKQDTSEKGVANGYGSLDSDIKSPVSERPFVFFTAIESGRITTAATLTATAQNYAPTGWLTNDIFRQDIDVNNRIIGGLLAPPAGVNRIVGICNINTGGFDIRFTHEDPGSDPENRLAMRDAAQKSSKPNEMAWFWYDHVSTRWRPFNRIG